jgi:hypothetical protein
MLNLQVFSDIYNSFIHFSGLNVALIIAKSVCIILVLLQYSRLYFKAYNLNGKFSIEFYELLRPLAIVAILASYTFFYDTLNNVLILAEREVLVDLRTLDTENKGAVEGKVGSAITSDNKQVAPPSKQEEGNSTGITAMFTKEVSAIHDIMTFPSVLMIKVITFLTELLDALIYGFVLIIRFAFLFILRFLGPFAIAASVYDHYKNVFHQWIKALVILYLWVFVIFLINLFTGVVATAMYKLKYLVVMPDVNPVTDAVSSIATDQHYNIAYSTTLLMMVMVKLYLYFKSKKLLGKIFT